MSNTFRLLMIDNNTNQQFNRSLKNQIDFAKLHDEFSLGNEEAVYLPHYFLQLKEGDDRISRASFVKAVESLGWNVDQGIKTSVGSSEGTMIEAMSLCINTCNLIGEWFSRRDNSGEYYKMELVLCAQSLIYSKLIKDLNAKYADVSVTLVTDPEVCDELLLTLADKVVDVKNLNIGRA